MKDIISRIVNNHQGLTGVDLALKVMHEVNPVKFNAEQFAEATQKLVDDGEIVEVEFTLPNMEYRIKSIYFPKGTTIYVNLKDNPRSTTSRVPL